MLLKEQYVVTLTERPLTYLIEHGSDLIGFILMSKENSGSCLFKHARGYTIGFASLADATVTNMYTLNKYAFKELDLQNFSKTVLLQLDH